MTTTTPGAPATLVRTSPRSPNRGAGAEARPGSYERISKFREAKTGAEVERGVDRQYRDACRAAEELDLPTPRRYTDDGFSASEFRTKEREAWPDFLEDVRTGVINRPMFWLFDRAFRTTEDSDAFIRAARAGGALIVQTGGWAPLLADPHDPEDMYRLKDAALKAEYEVARMSLRQRRHKEAMAHAGVAPGGKRRFGYTADMSAVVESEAVVIRELAARFLAGESLRSLARWLNDNNHETPSAEARRRKGQTPAKWTGPNVAQMLGRPHLAGLRVHHGEVVEGVAATWAPILTVETHRHLATLLNAPDRRATGSTNTRKWLLTGLAVCDECGETVICKPRRGDKVPVYQCRTGRHVHKPAELADAVVERFMVTRLTKYAGRLFTGDEAGAELVRLRDARAALDAQAAEYEAEAGSMPAKAYAAATRTLEAEGARLDQLITEAEAVVHRATRILDGATGDGAGLAWFGDGTEEHPGWDLSRRRALIAELATVRLRSSGKGTRFAPEDVIVAPRARAEG